MGRKKQKQNTKNIGALLASLTMILSLFEPALTANAQVPQTINYQSRLRTNTGVPIVASTTIQFSLYDHVSNGSSGDAAGSSGPLLWKEIYDQSSGACAKIQPDAQGYFYIQLGSCVAFPDYIKFDSPIYLGVKIESDVEASPRVLLASFPYALNSQRVNSLEATTTATGGQLLALENDLSFNIATGTFYGGGLSVTGTSTLQNFTFTVATGTSLNLSNYLAIGAIRLDSTGSNNVTSGAYLVGVFDEFDNSNATTVQAVLSDLDTAISYVSSTLYNISLDTAYDAGGSGAGKTIVTDAGPITITNTTGTFGFMSVTHSTNAEGLWVNNLGNGSAFSARNMGSGAGFYSRNQGTGYGARLDNSTDNGLGLYIDNSNNGLGLRLDNAGSNFGAAIYNNANGIGLHIQNSSSTGMGMYLRQNNGQGLVLDNNTANHGINVTNNSTGNGIFVDNQSSGRAIYVSDAGTKTAVQVDKVLNGGNAIAINTDNSAKAFYITHNGNGESFWMRNQGTGASLWIEDSATDLTPFVLNASGYLGIGTSTPAYDLDINGNSRLSGQFMLGRYLTLPGSGYQSGSVVYNSSSSTINYWDGSIWRSVATAEDVRSSLWDMDHDTGVQVEESADEDIIRFDTAGSQRMYIRNDGRIGIGTNENLVSLFTVGPGAHEASTFSASGIPGMLNIANFRDENGENVFRAAGSVAGNDLVVGFGDLDYGGIGTSIQIDYAQNAVKLSRSQLRFQDNGGGEYVGFISPATVTTSTIWTLPNGDGTQNGQALATDASGNLYWRNVDGAGSVWDVDGDTGIQVDNGSDNDQIELFSVGNKVAHFGNSPNGYSFEIYDNSGNRLIGPGVSFNNSGAGAEDQNIGIGDLDNADNGTWFGVDTGAQKFGFNEGDVAFVSGKTGTAITEYRELLANGDNYVGFRAPTSIASNVAWTLPNADGLSNQVLVTNGLGTLSWATSSDMVENIYTADGDLAGDRTVSGDGVGLGVSTVNGGYFTADINDGTDTTFLHVNPDEMELSSASAAAYSGMVFNSGGASFTHNQSGSSTQFYIGSTMTLADGINLRGINYAADYSANYTARTLVDKGYVDSAITSSTVAAGNGLTLASGTMNLGGDLSQTTYIDHQGYDLIIREFAGEPETIFSGDNFKIIDTTRNRRVQFGISGVDTSGVEWRGDAQHDIYYRDNALYINSNTSTFGGVQYALDYSGNYTDRSLVDKAYVDDHVSAITLQGAADNSIAADGYVYYDTGAAYWEDDGGAMKLEAKAGGYEVAIGEAGASRLYFKSDNGVLNPTQIKFIDNRSAGNKAGIEYFADYSSDYTLRSLVDKAYVDNAIVAATTTLNAAYNAGGTALGRRIYTTASTTPVEIINPGNDQWETALALTNGVNNSGFAFQTQDSYGDRGAKLFFTTNTSDPLNGSGSYMDWNEQASSFEFGYQTAGARDSSFYIDYNQMSLNVPGTSSNGAFLIGASNYNVPVLTLRAPGINNSVQVTVGTSTPEAKVIANSGSLFTRTDGVGGGEQLYVKTTDGGNTGWVPLSSAGTVADLDGDTKIQVEETSDEDYIRFDTAGTERMYITNSGDLHFADGGYVNAYFNIDNPSNPYIGDPSLAGIYLDSGNDRVSLFGTEVYVKQDFGVGVANPNAKVDIGEGMISNPRGDMSVLLSQDGGDSFFETASGDMAEGLLMLGSPGNGWDYGVIRNIASNGYATGWDRGLHIFTSSTGLTDDPIILSTDSVERMRILDNGRIAIGSSTASSKLYIEAGNGEDALITVNSDDGNGNGNDAGLVINSDYSNGSDAAFVRFLNNGTQSGKMYSSPAGSGFIVDGSQSYDVTTNGQTRFFIAGAGNVGISTTTPGYRLDVQGDSRVSAQFMLGRYAVNPASGNQAGAMIYNTASSTPFVWDGGQWLPIMTGGLTSTGWMLAGNTGTNPGTDFIGTTDNKALYFKTNNTNAMLITASGLVGIGAGVGIPSHGLEVASDDGFGFYDGSGDQLVEVSGNLGSGTALIQFGDAGGVDTETAFSIVPALSKFTFMHGDVGISTSSPAYRLDVVGDARLTAQLMLGRYAVNPASGNQAGAMIYNTASSTPFYWNGTEWKALLGGIPNAIWDVTHDTGITTEYLPDEDILRFFTGDANYFTMEGPQFSVLNSGNSVFMGQDAGRVDDLTTNNNVFIGRSAGYSNTSGFSNVYIGYEAGYAATTQESTVAIGREAGRNNTGAFGNTMLGYYAGANSTGNDNVMIGYESGVGNTGGDNFFMGRGTGWNNTGSQNIMMGYFTGYDNKGSSNILFGSNTGSGNKGTNGIFMGANAGYNNVGNDNIFLGYNTGRNNATGTRNLFLGREAGYSNVLGNGNVFLGYQAGYSETGSDRLYIDNSNTANPLVYGQFDNNILRINGALQINNPSSTGYALPTVDGNTGQILVTNGSGVISWASTTSLGLDLQQVTDNGFITDNRIIFAGATSSGDIIPAAHDTYTLGNTTYRWSDVWGSNVHIGTSTWDLAQSADGSLTVSSAGSEKYRVQSNGYFGLGTNQPEKLFSLGGGDMLIGQFNGAVAPIGGYSRQMIIRATDGQLPGIQGTAYTTYQRNGVDIAQVGIDTSNNIAFRNNGGSWSTDVVIASSGNMGIGNTSPTRKLDIAGGKDPGDNLFRITGGANDAYISMYADIIDDRNSVIEVQRNLDFYSQSTRVMTIENSGRVGIGTNIPDNNFHVMASDAGGSSLANTIATFERNDHAYMQFLVPNNRSTGLLFGDNDSANIAGLFYTHSIDMMQFRVNNDVRANIDSSGHFTLNNGVNPGNAILDVRGDAIFNEDGGDYDFRVESASSTQSLFVNGATGQVNIGDASLFSTAILTLDGDLSLNSNSGGNRYITVDAVTGFADEGTDLRIQAGGGVAGEPGDLHLQGGSSAGTFGAVYLAESGGRVIIGSMNARSAMDVTANGEAVATFDRLSTDGTIVSLRQEGVEEGTISVSANTVSYNAFTGSHYSWTNETIEKGMLVSLTGDNRYFNNNVNSEILYGIKKTSEVNDSKVMGSYLSLQEPSKAASDSNPHLIMAVGNGEVWIADKGENINIGDYIISSDVAGHGQKDTGEFLVSHIVARAAESIDWTHVSTQIDGVKHKKISVFFESFDKNNMQSSVAGTSLQGGDDVVDVADLVVANAVFEGNITVKGHAAYGKDVVGQAMIMTGDTRVSVKFENEYGTLPIVTVTPAGKVTVPYWVENASIQGFDIVLNEVQYADLLFNWHSFGNDEGRVYVSNGTTLDIVTNDMGSSDLETQLNALGQEPESQEEATSTQVVIIGNNVTTSTLDVPLVIEEATTTEDVAEPVQDEPLVEEEAPLLEEPVETNTSSTTQL